jgi:exonuclease VII small subunit
MQTNGDRLDRIERGIEALLNSMATLADAQVKLSEAQTRLSDAQTVQHKRSDDHEEAILDLEAEHRRLLAAQVITADNLAKITHRLEETDAKLNALIEVVDDFIRRQPKQ